MNLTGKETFDIEIPEDIKVQQDIIVRTNKGEKIVVKCRIDTDVEIEYYKHGGILPYVLRKLIQS